MNPEIAFTWIKDHAPALGGTLLIWLVTLVVSAWGARLYLISIPADHFVRPVRPPRLVSGRRPLLQWAWFIAKNVTGLAMIICGLLMLVAPGPGMIVLLLGLYLVDFPAKRHLERAILMRPAIRATVDRLREKANRPALLLAPNAPN